MLLISLLVLLFGAGDSTSSPSVISGALSRCNVWEAPGCAPPLKLMVSCSCFSIVAVSHENAAAVYSGGNSRNYL